MCWGPKHKVSSDIYLANLNSRRIRRITYNHGSSEPAYNGSYLAWKQGRPGGTRFVDGTIRLMSLATGRTVIASVRMPGRGHPRCATKDTYIQACADEPVISSDILEWTLNNGIVIVARNLRTGTQYPVFQELGKLNSPSSYRPRNVWGNRIVWVSLRRRGNTVNLSIATALVP
ncbi:MAG TPA: hypothetical protein VG815_05105, partial [Chloroflexota bacterium]|nr:hypothetical protein [Chloroflexota bacterium]